MSTGPSTDIQLLIQATQTLNADDAFNVRLSADQWRTLGSYLTRHEIRAGDLLIQQGDRERTMYLLEQGSLQVFLNRGAPGSHRIAIPAFPILPPCHRIRGRFRSPQIRPA